MMPKDNDMQSSMLDTDDNGEDSAGTGDSGGKRRTYTPESNMEIAVIARKRVRSMISILASIARDKDCAPSPRVSAAKALIEFARLKPEDVRKLSDEEIRTLAKKIVEDNAASKGEAKALLKDSDKLQ